jgi:hypothetical protein
VATSKYIIPGEWESDTSPLPTERDFTPFNDLDAQWAWKQFGGLSRTKAYERFLENPLCRQEDFMFMGGAAFAYYYPVIERYLYEAAEQSGEPDDREAWILAKGIQIQFSGELLHLRHLAPRILALAKFVRSNLPLYESESDGQQRIDAAWAELESHVTNIRP